MPNFQGRPWGRSRCPAGVWAGGRPAEPAGEWEVTWLSDLAWAGGRGPWEAPGVAGWGRLEEVLGGACGDRQGSL